MELQETRLRYRESGSMDPGGLSVDVVLPADNTHPGTVKGRSFGFDGYAPAFERYMEPSEQRHLRRLLARVRIGTEAPSMMGRDGTTYRLIIDYGWTTVALKWWAEPPADWRRITSLARALERMAGV